MTVNRTIDKCIKLAQRQMEGCLFVIEKTDSVGRYFKDQNADIMRGDGKDLSVFEDGQAIQALSSVDGATIISKEGDLLHYGATLKRSEAVKGHGKRHAFAKGTSEWEPDVVCILHSEEDHHVRAYQEGVCVFDMDSKGKKIEDTVRHRIAELLCNPLTSTLAASGIIISLFTLSPFPALITISGSQIMAHGGMERLRKLIEG